MALNFALRHRLISALYDADIKGIRRVAHHLPEILIPKPSGPVTIKTLYGFNLLVDPVRDQGVEKSIYYSGTYEKGTLYIIGQLLSEGAVFVDVGANIGLMSIYASYLVKDTGKVIAFEPNPGTLELLQSNIRLNEIQNIEVSDFALGNEIGTSTIYDRWDSNRGSASLIKPENAGTSHEVRVITLDSYLPVGQQIRLIKLDIEGYELEALKGATEILGGKSPPMLIVECSESADNPTGQRSAGLYTFLCRSFQYRLFRSTGGKERISRLVEIYEPAELPKGDNMYCFTDDHLKEVSKKLFARNQKLPLP